MSSLQLIGFTSYEARAYGTLVRHPRLNGYELAKHSGIPRANIYAVLDKLVLRGAVLRVERDDGPRYVAVDPDQLLDEIESGHRQALEHARRELAMLVPHEEPPAVFNLHGDEWRLQAQRLVAGATQSLWVAIHPQEAKLLAGVLQDARERGVAITTLCLAGCSGDCGHCQGDVHCHRFPEPDGQRQLVLLADAARTLMARFRGRHTDAVLSSQPLLVQLASAHVRERLALAVLGNELGARRGARLPAPARALLDRLFPGDFVGWISNTNGGAA